MGKHVGSFIRQLREDSGLSQSEVARKLSLKTAQSISNIERGVSPLPRAKIKRLADILGVKKSEILNIVLQEMQDRYSKAAGVQGKALVLSADISSDEQELLAQLVETLRSSKAVERSNLKKQLKKILA